MSHGPATRSGRAARVAKNPDQLSGGHGRPSPRTGTWRVSLASSAASALGMSRREMLGERQVAAPLMAQRAAHGAVRLAHRRFQPGPCVSIELAGLRRSGKPQRPPQCQFGHEPLVLVFALFAPAASRPGQHRAMRRQCGRQVAPCGHASTVRQPFVRLVRPDTRERRGSWTSGAEPEPAVRDLQVASLAGTNCPPARRMPPMRGLAPSSVVVVTGPAELPFSQADQDCCQ